MKSSAMAAIVRLFGRDDQLSRAMPDSLEGNAREDQEAAGDFHRVQGLGEQNQREEDREERLQVREERSAGHADDVDRPEPEDVREKERPDDRVRERDPDERLEVERLMHDLVCAE